MKIEVTVIRNYHLELNRAEMEAITATLGIALPLTVVDEIKSNGGTYTNIYDMWKSMDKSLRQKYPEA